MTKGEMLITRYGDLAIKFCLDYHKLQSKQAKNVVIQKVHFLFLFFFFFFFANSDLINLSFGFKF